MILNQKYATLKKTNISHVLIDAFIKYGTLLALFQSVLFLIKLHITAVTETTNVLCVCVCVYVCVCVCVCVRALKQKIKCFLSKKYNRAEGGIEPLGI